MTAGRMRIFALASTLSAVVACRTAPARDRAVEFWALGREGEVAAQLIPEFERRHPGVRVRLQQIPWSAAHEKLLTAYVGEAMPDVFQIGNTWIPEFAALHAVDALDERLRQSPSNLRADYFPGILDTNVVDGATYALPWYVDTRVLFYRSDLLAEAGYGAPPRTWAEWLEAMERIKRRAPSGSFALLMPVNEWQPLVIFALQVGATMLRDGDSYGDFRSPAFRRAFAFYVDLFRARLAPLASQAEVANLYQDFARGVFAFYVTGPWNIGEFDARLPPALKGKWTTAPLPAPDEARAGASLAGGASLAIFRGSQRKDAAWQLVAFLSEPAEQRELYRLTGDLPARKSAWAEGGPENDPHARAFRTQLESLHTPPKIPEWERIAAEITRYAEAVVRERLTADEALARLDADVDALLEKRRWMLHHGMR